ncbi:helix-turn-helix transcriptional regulator (plasmid) [Vibrio sp. VNB-15]
MSVSVYQFNSDCGRFELQEHNRDWDGKLSPSQLDVFWVIYSSSPLILIGESSIENIPAYVFVFFKPGEIKKVTKEQVQGEIDCIEMPRSFFSDDVVTQLLEKRRFNGISVRQIMAMARRDVGVFIPFVRGLLPVALVSDPVDSESKHQKVFARIKGVIERNYWNSELYLEQVATLCFCSKRKVQSTLAKELLTFSELTNRVRVTSFCQMLLETQLSIDVISYQCGFNSLNYATRQFKQVVGVTPKQYRAEFYDEIYSRVGVR